MKLFIKLWLCVTLMSIGFEGWTQGFVENALLFSRTKPGGSARIQAMGGAQVALGGDFSSALSNPAGLGMYNRSEFTFSPALNTYKADSEHLGTAATDSKNVFNIPGLSYVHNMSQDKNGFLGGSFGGSMARVNDFNNTFQYEGLDNATSIIDYFLEDATGFTPDNLGSDIRTALGYDNYLLEDSSYYGANDTDYFSVLGTYPDDPTDIRELKRTGSTTIKGAQYQWSFAYGGNFQDKLFFGANVGLTTLRYRFKSTYRESDFAFEQDPTYNPLNSLSLTETVDIEGSGFNLTLGVIYRPINYVQIGISFVTPTYYEMLDSYSAKVSTQWNNYNYLGEGEILNSVSSELTDPIVSEYSFTTPLKFSTGAAFFLGKYGFITGDVEFINYSKAKYESSIQDVSFKPENRDIKASYSNVVNYRIGTELRYSIFKLRGGYSYQGNPYKDEFNVDRKITTISMGAGVRFTKFFIDAAWLTSKSNSSYSPFAFQNETGPVAALRNKATSVMITVGFTF
jgi:hypothetical protein